MKLKLNISKSEIEKYYYIDKLRQIDIANIHNVSRSAVQRLQKKYDLQPLENWEKKCSLSISNIQREVLFGTALGDDCLYQYSTSIYGTLMVCHAISQKEYVKLKYDIWKDFVTEAGMTEVKRDNGKRIVFKTVCHPEFLKYRKEYYDNKGIKVIKLFHLERLTQISIAFLFQDDGSRCKNGGLAIHSNCFTLNEVEMICEYFRKKYSWNCYPQKRKENQWVVFFSNETSMDFSEFILPYVHPSMRYKLEGVYIKNPQRLNAVPFIYDNLTGKSQSELCGNTQNSKIE